MTAKSLQQYPNKLYCFHALVMTAATAAGWLECFMQYWHTTSLKLFRKKGKDNQNNLQENYWPLPIRKKKVSKKKVMHCQISIGAVRGHSGSFFYATRKKLLTSFSYPYLSWGTGNFLFKQGNTGLGGHLKTFSWRKKSPLKGK